MKLWVLIAISLLFSGASTAQNPYPEIDSLLNRAEETYQINLDTALVYANKAYQLALASKDTNTIAKTSVAKSFYHFTRDEPEEVEKVLQFIFENEEKVPLSNLGQAYNHMGGIYYRHKGMEDALRMYFKAVDIQEKAANTAGLARTYLNLGMIYRKLEKDELAEYFFEKSSQNASHSKNASIHDLSNSEGLTGARKQLEMTTKALMKIEDKDNSVLAAVMYSDRCNIHLDLGNYTEAIADGEKALAIMDRVNFGTNYQLTHYYIGTACVRSGRFEKAKFHLNKAIESTNILKFKAQFYEQLIEANERSGDYPAAFRASTQFSKIKDSINTIQENDRIAAITAQFETEKQAQEIEILEGDNKLKAAQLKNQRSILFATIGGVALLLTLLFFAYKNHKIKQNLQFSELTQKLLLMQLNPHFLFNALNGIQYFIKKNDTKKSTRYITNFSGLMRNILENSVEKFISIKEDHDTISDFLALQQLVHNNSFEYQVEIDENLDASNTAIPPMFTQPFVENAIIHGVSGVSEGKIIVNYRLENDRIRVDIIDNGKGIHSEKKNANSLHKSMGTSITKQRMENLLKAEKYPVELEITSQHDGKDGQGTKIILTFPLKYL